MIDNLVKVKDHPGLYRDPITKAIIIDDPQARKSYLAQRNVLQKSLSSVESVQEEINILKEDISSMKSMIEEIVKHLKNN